MTNKTLELTPEVYRYLQNNSLRESDVLKKLREETSQLTMARMQIAPEQGQLMRLLVELIQAKKTLEIGVFTGYSALSVAYSLPKDGKVVACDISEEWTDIAKKYWQMAGISHLIDLRLGPALETLDSLLNNGEADTFDFAFIDADKSNYPIYYEKALTLVRPGGLIAIDNVLWDGQVADPKINNKSTTVLRELNAKIHQDERVMMSMVPIGDGVTLVLKR